MTKTFLLFSFSSLPQISLASFWQHSTIMISTTYSFLPMMQHLFIPSFPCLISQHSSRTAPKKRVLYCTVLTLCCVPPSYSCTLTEMQHTCTNLLIHSHFPSISHPLLLPATNEQTKKKQQVKNKTSHSCITQLPNILSPPPCTVLYPHLFATVFFYGEICHHLSSPSFFPLWLFTIFIFCPSCFEMGWRRQMQQHCTYSPSILYYSRRGSFFDGLSLAHL